jgi:hypothetical protein
VTCCNRAIPVGSVVFGDCVDIVSGSGPPVSHPSTVYRAYEDMERQLCVSVRQDIERLLLRGLAPITDNAAALIELGFSRAYPNAARGFESTVWERSLDRGYRQTGRGLRRVLVRQRAFLAAQNQR